jgi:hypothetical protein
MIHVDPCFKFYHKFNLWILHRHLTPQYVVCLHTCEYINICVMYLYIFVLFQVYTHVHRTQTYSCTNNLKHENICIVFIQNTFHFKCLLFIVLEKFIFNLIRNWEFKSGQEPESRAFQFNIIRVQYFLKSFIQISFLNINFMKFSEESLSDNIL